jgi:hypothetical protein
VGNLKGRVRRLEGGKQGPGAPIIIVKPGETTDEAVQKYMDQHPEADPDGVKIIIRGQCQNEK